MCLMTGPENLGVNTEPVTLAACPEMAFNFSQILSASEQSQMGQSSFANIEVKSTKSFSSPFTSVRLSQHVPCCCELNETALMLPLRNW